MYNLHSSNVKQLRNKLLDNKLEISFVTMNKSSFYVNEDKFNAWNNLFDVTNFSRSPFVNVDGRMEDRGYRFA